MPAVSENHEHVLKFLLVGDSDVGKEEIADLIQSPGVVPKQVVILLDGKRVRLLLWDASGQGRFSTIFKSYSHGAQGILLVYDITNRWSFHSIRRWIAETNELAPGIPKILVGNRLHLEFNRSVSRQEAESFARKHTMQYYEVSTLVQFNIRECLTELSRLVISRNGFCGTRRSRVSSLQDTCCRAIVQTISNVHAVERFPIPASLKLKVRSFVRGAELCMGPSPNSGHHFCKQYKSKRMVQYVRTNKLIKLIRSLI